jgi:hypothetical protein
MPVTYDINTELDLIIYYCTGTITGADFFKTGDLVALDARFHDKMKIIIDCFQADFDVSVSDMHLAIAKNKEVKQRGQELGKTGVLTRSTSLNFLGEALKLISQDAPSNFAIFNNRPDVLCWLELPEQAANQFWDTLETKAKE